MLSIWIGWKSWQPLFDLNFQPRDGWSGYQNGSIWSTESVQLKQGYLNLTLIKVVSFPPPPLGWHIWNKVQLTIGLNNSSNSSRFLCHYVRITPDKYSQRDLISFIKSFKGCHICQETNTSTWEMSSMIKVRSWHWTVLSWVYYTSIKTVKYSFEICHFSKIIPKTTKLVSLY